MAYSDSMFLFEIVIEDLRSHVKAKGFLFKSKFTDLFELTLRNPTDVSLLSSPRTKKSNNRRKSKVRQGLMPIESGDTRAKIQSGQSVLFASNILQLIKKMETFPLEFTMWSKNNPARLLGSTQIPWDKSYLNYLYASYIGKEVHPVAVSENHVINSVTTLKCIAAVKINIKVCHLKGNISSRLTSFTKYESENFSNEYYTSQSSLKTDVIHETGIIKTNFKEGKRRYNKTVSQKSNTLLIIDDTKKPIDEAETMNSEKNKFTIDETKVTRLKTVDDMKNKILTLIKSDTVIEHKPIENSKSRSFSSLQIKPLFNAYDYIFPNYDRPLTEQMYYVGYVTINDNSKEKIKCPKSSDFETPNAMSVSSSKSFDCRCPTKSNTGSCTHNLKNLTKPCVSKCNKLECDANKGVVEQPDNKILLDLSNLKTSCCNVTENMEVVGGMKAKMKIGNIPCECTCECSFGFFKKTTYCGVCGGFEVAGIELANQPAHAIFPCPIYHKLAEQKKLRSHGSVEGSDKVKKDDSSHKSLRRASKVGSVSGQLDKKSLGVDKSVESESSKGKKGKKKIDSRFKFNYGYQGIPPHIGHEHCGAPCSGTLESVPKHMGWLWTAENVPGLKIHKGWKPGAISKRLLKTLNRAKLRMTLVEQQKRIKKMKKHVESKPTLIVRKIDGSYRVEMQVVDGKKDIAQQERYSPLIYEIASATNEERKRKRQKYQRKLIREATKEVWSDSYNTEACENICLWAYKQAIGATSDDKKQDCVSPNLDIIEEESSCSSDGYDDSVSFCSSMDWEIHFTPPADSNVRSK